MSRAGGLGGLLLSLLALFLLVAALAGTWCIALALPYFLWIYPLLASALLVAQSAALCAVVRWVVLRRQMSGVRASVLGAFVSVPIQAAAGWILVATDDRIGDGAWIVFPWAAMSLLSGVVVCPLVVGLIGWMMRCRRS